MKKIGTHNSLSYLRPRQWWLRPLAWVARCQGLDIPGQWNAGVRYFDIRIRFRKDQAISGHGLIDYDVDVYDWIEYLDVCSQLKASEETVVVRLMLEESCTKDDEKFREFVQKCQKKNPHLTFVGGLRKEPFEVIVPAESVPERLCYKFFQDYSAKTLWQKIRGVRFPYPRYWAKRDNAKYLSEANESVFTIVDFVE